MLNLPRTHTPDYKPLITRLRHGLVLCFFLLASSGSGAAQTPPPSAPTVGASGGLCQITVSWNSVPNAFSYEEYIGDSPSGPFYLNSTQTSTTQVAGIGWYGLTKYFYVLAKGPGG